MSRGQTYNKKNQQEQEVKTSEHVVAYLDILGASKMIFENEDKHLQTIMKVYEQTKNDHKAYLAILKKKWNEEIKKLREIKSIEKITKSDDFRLLQGFSGSLEDLIPLKKYTESIDDQEALTLHGELEKISFTAEELKEALKYKIRIFSDNIIISIPAYLKESKKNYQRTSETIFTLTAILIKNFALEGILLRGGITCGNFFSNNELVWGTALIRAYNLENKHALYPRVIVDNNLLENLNITGNNKIFFSTLNRFLTKDFDDTYFIDFVRYSLSDDILKDIDELIDSKKPIYEDDPLDVIQKKSWYINFLNKTKNNYEADNEQNEK